MVYIRQHQSSSLSAPDIENYVKDIENDRFHDAKNSSGPTALKYKEKVSIKSSVVQTINEKIDNVFRLIGNGSLYESQCSDLS